jgi:hypothetical protein
MKLKGAGICKEEDFSLEMPASWNAQVVRCECQQEELMLREHIVGMLVILIVVSLLVSRFTKPGSQVPKLACHASVIIPGLLICNDIAQIIKQIG